MVLTRRSKKQQIANKSLKTNSIRVPKKESKPKTKITSKKIKKTTKKVVKGRHPNKNTKKNQLNK